jgi:hypothetical protein
MSYRVTNRASGSLNFSASNTKALLSGKMFSHFQHQKLILTTHFSNFFLNRFYSTYDRFPLKLSTDFLLTSLDIDGSSQYLIILTSLGSTHRQKISVNALQTGSSFNQKSIMFLYFALPFCSASLYASQTKTYYCILFGWFPGVWILCANVSKHSVLFS